MGGVGWSLRFKAHREKFKLSREAGPERNGSDDLGSVPSGLGFVSLMKDKENLWEWVIDNLKGAEGGGRHPHPRTGELTQ